MTSNVFPGDPFVSFHIITIRACYPFSLDLFHFNLNVCLHDAAPVVLSAEAVFTLGMDLT